MRNSRDGVTSTDPASASSCRSIASLAELCVGGCARRGPARWGLLRRQVVGKVAVLVCPMLCASVIVRIDNYILIGMTFPGCAQVLNGKALIPSTTTPVAKQSSSL
jgi:hypothetical protein